MESAEFIAIGGGLIGLATAYYYQQANPASRVLILEKEADIAQHQSSHNSNSLHVGLGLQPGSLKAQHVALGHAMLVDFCREEKLPFVASGQLMLAVDSAEIDQLNALQADAEQNGTTCHLLDQQQLTELEPHAAGLAALYTPDAAVVDYQSIARRLALRIEMAGGRVMTNQQVIGLQERDEVVIIQTKETSFIAKYAVNAAGLFADRLARKTSYAEDIKILPFRGEYLQLRPEACQLVRSQIFPVPNPSLPFTGIHLTRQVDGSVLCGPNAILAGSREGYKRGNISLRDSLDQMTSQRVRRLTRQNLATAIWEQRRSWSKELFTLTLQRLVPSITVEDVVSAPAGVSAYAIGSDGKLIDDFVFEQTQRMVHVISAPSPAASACLSIGRSIADSFT